MHLYARRKVIVQLKLLLPGEKALPPPMVWEALDPDAQAALVRTLAKTLVKSVGPMQQEVKDGEQADDRENKNQLNAFGAECNRVCSTIDTGSTREEP
jgi:hypothetical protein